MKKFYIAKTRRLRGTPYSSRIESQGLTAYTTYNHMLLPASFEGTEKEYFHLKEHVQVWDVSGERQVQITGKDSAKLVQKMTCRDISKFKIGGCYYCLIIDDKGGLINDPELILMDEPLGALDALTREKMQSLVLKLWKETGKTIILITHSVEEALLLGERLYVMAPRPGRFHKEYKLPFASMALKGDLREIKNNNEFVSKREEILSMIWNMEEEIMGKEI